MGVHRRIVFFLSLAAAIVVFSTASPAAEDFVRSLTKDNIRAFLEESRTISTAQNTDMTPEDVTAYFERHLSDKGVFKSETLYELPGFPQQVIPQSFDKAGFIQNLAGGSRLMEDYETALDITDIKIERGGHAATLQTTITEKGRLPWPGSDQGKQETLPVKGISECEQKLIVSPKGYIQLQSVDCKTLVSFSAFSKPLGE